MTMKILIVETPTFRAPSTLFPEAKRCEMSQWKDVFKALLTEKQPVLILAPLELKRDQQISEAMAGAFGSVSVVHFSQADDLATHAEPLGFFTNEERTTGVKCCLSKGSTIYSESIFNPGNIGSKLDPCLQFARGKLSPASTVEAWGALQSLVFLGLQHLPNYGEGNTGERIDIQVGADDKCVAYSIRFDLPLERLREFRMNTLLDLPKSSADILEIRYWKNAGKMEILCWFSRTKSPEWTIEAQSFQESVPLEKKEDVKEYTFKSLSAIVNTNKEEKRIVKGSGFKKKFSEKVKGGKEEVNASVSVIQADPSIPPTEETRIKAAGDIGDTTKTVVKDKSVAQPETITVIKADTQNPRSAPTSQTPTPTPSEEKSENLWQSKIQGLETAVKQRDELIAKLNKEIVDIKDPLKMGVISSIKDDQLQGLKDNIKRLEGEVVEAQKREKELMTVVDKAIQLKDDAVKKMKDLDSKLKNASGGNNSKIITLEKQLEEQRRQNKELSKRVSSLVEQLQAAGKRAA